MVVPQTNIHLPTGVDESVSKAVTNQVVISFSKEVKEPFNQLGSEWNSSVRKITSGKKEEVLSKIEALEQQIEELRNETNIEEKVK